MLDRLSSPSSAVVPVLGTLYLLYLVTQPPPARWVGLGCLVVLVPFGLGWLAGRVWNVGPWADVGE